MDIKFLPFDLKLYKHPLQSVIFTATVFIVGFLLFFFTPFISAIQNPANTVCSILLGSVISLMFGFFLFPLFIFFALLVELMRLLFIDKKREKVLLSLFKVFVMSIFLLATVFCSLFFVYIAGQIFCSFNFELPLNGM